MAASAVTEAEHPTGNHREVEPPRSWGWTQVITLVVFAVVAGACIVSAITAAP